MKRFALTAILFIAAFTFAARGDDAPKPEAKPDAPAASGPEQTKTGTLGEKPLTAAEGIVAVLHVPAGDAPAAADNKDKKEGKKAAKKADRQEKKGKKATAAAAGPEQTFTLAATGDVATKLADLARRSANVEVKGVVSGDTIKVSSVVEKAATAQADNNTEKKKKKDKKNKA